MKKNVTRLISVVMMMLISLILINNLMAQSKSAGTVTFQNKEGTKAAPGCPPEMEHPPTVNPAVITVKVWPNPSSDNFTLRITDDESNQPVHIKVTDNMGRLAYKARSAGIKDYYFGDDFIPGIYFAEIIQGDNKTSFKLIKF